MQNILSRIHSALTTCKSCLKTHILPKPSFRFTALAVLLLAAFSLGQSAAKLTAPLAHPAAFTAPPALPVAFTAPLRLLFQKNSTSADGNWGLSFPQEGKPPVANASMDYLKQFNAYYAKDTKDKVLYLTFDAGFENGNTAPILEALKKHNAKATFFLVGNFLETQPELVKQMVAEGHTVGNHTYHHPDMSKISTKEAFKKELTDLESLYQNVTGQPMTKYYRPPQGKYSEKNLQMAKELGYHTFFWSLAYVDWYQDRQPSREEAFQKLIPRVHPGAIVLLHSTSKTNAEILDELLTNWEELGYHFSTLAELTQPD